MEMVTMTSGSRKLRSELGNALMESVSLRERRRRNVVERERERVEAASYKNVTQTLDGRGSPPIEILSFPPIFS
jgi:hypothetical protein